MPPDEQNGILFATRAERRRALQQQRMGFRAALAFLRSKLSQPFSADPLDRGLSVVHASATKQVPAAAENRPARSLTVTPLTHFLLCGLLSAGIIAASLNPTLSAFTASVTNNANFAGSGALTLEQRTTSGTQIYCASDGRGDSFPTVYVTDTAPVKDNAVDCTYSLYGSNMTMTPGTTATQTIKIANPAGAMQLDANSLTVKFGACSAYSQSPAGTAPSPNVCHSFTADVVAVKTGAGGGTQTVLAATPVASIPASTYTVVNNAAGGNFPNLRVTPGETMEFRIGLKFPANATASNDNLVQNQKVSQDITWQFNN